MTGTSSQFMPFNPDTQNVADTGPKGTENIIFTPTEGGLTAQRDPAAPAPAPVVPANAPSWQKLGFKSDAEMEKSYTELRTKMSQPKTEEKPAEPVVAPVLTKEEAAKPEVVAAETAKQEAIDKVAGEAFAAEKDVKVDDVVAWAQTALSPESQAKYNEALDTGNPETIKFAVKALTEAYRKTARPAEPKLVTNLPPAPPGPAIQGYKDTSEMVKDMQNPIYQTSEAFRAEVAAKIKASKNI